MQQDTVIRFVITIALLLQCLCIFAVQRSHAELVVWANDGHDKVVKDELRMSNGGHVSNSVWQADGIRLFGARNEVVSFNLILESPSETTNGITVNIDSLIGPGGASIRNEEHMTSDPFNYVGKNIEVFIVRYLQIIGVSRLSYMPDYDERHVPERLRLPFTLPKGTSRGTFQQRPNANKFYPDIAVPAEVIGAFSIPADENQSVWVDIYIPRDAAAGTYTGDVTIGMNGKSVNSIPLKLEVHPFSLPERFNAKTMVWLNEPDMNTRYTGVRWMDSGAATQSIQATMRRVWHKHHQMAKRHRISLFSEGDDLFRRKKMQRWEPVLNGKLFTQAHDYAGPGEGIPGDVYVAGTYGSWRALKSWDKESRVDMWTHTDTVMEYFTSRFPDTDVFLYLLDEPKKAEFTDVEKWAKWVDENPAGPGKHIETLCTINLVQMQKYMPSLDVAFELWSGDDTWEEAIAWSHSNGKRVMSYNGWRPGSGTYLIEDDGVALRVNGWIQFKHKIDRWFYWAGTNYRNPSYSNYETNVFREAVTFGRKNDKMHPKYGETGPGYNNGDGVLFYPGTDTVHPDDSYELEGPIASLRLKYWRRGLQDYEYLQLAMKKNPEAVEELVKTMVPVSLWEVGVTDKNDPTYVHADISWSIDPDQWEQARKELADIILGK